MIFWFFVILTILGIGIIIAGDRIFGSYCIEFIGGMFVVISGVIAMALLCWIVIVQITADGNREMLEQRYKALICKSQAEIVSSEYIEEIQEWNEQLTKYQSYSNNIWISIFYPKREYEGLEVIDLENIKIKD